MEVWDALRTRLTVRQFKPDPVPDEIVTKPATGRALVS